MRLPIRVATAIRARQLIAPRERVLIALSGGPDSVALFHCLLELSRKRDLAFTLFAAHLNHGLRGKAADADEAFCRRLCARKKIPLLRAYAPTPEAAKTLKRSSEETARILRHAFLAEAAARVRAGCVTVAHHADDRIETVLYRLCRGTGLAGLRGIGWRGPLALEGEPDVRRWLSWRPAPVISNTGSSESIVVRPLLGIMRSEVLEYLRSKRQRYCTDETNFDVRIPRNALRRLVLPVLEQQVHPGVRAALWRLAEEAEVHAEKRALSREWLAGFAELSRRGALVLPAPRSGPPPLPEELGAALDVLRALWGLGESGFTRRHVQALRELFAPGSGPKQLALPGGLRAERRGRQVTLRRE